MRNKIGWYVAALLWHTLLDALAVFGIKTWGPYITEGVVFALALVSIGIIFALRKTDELPDVTDSPGDEPLETPVRTPAGLEPEEVTAKKLEESRYD